MLPYSDLPYFIVILLVALPAAILGALGRSRSGWILAATAIMAVVHFGLRSEVVWGRNVTELGVVVGYALVQLLLVTGYARWRRRHPSRVWLAIAILVSVVPLIATKVLGLTRPSLGVGFLGISYLTFRAVDALIVVGDQLETTIRPGPYLAFLLFPATLSAGPIDRYRRFAADFYGRLGREEFLAGVDAGIAVLFRGLLYKFIIAALIEDQLVNRVVGTTGVLGTLGYMYAYSGYLFFDFAGYSAIAIGVSRFFGIATPANFDRPFLAANIVDFWNRWHISLSSWFRDHVYMRFLLAATKGRWFGGRRYLASAIGFLVTFGLMGAWHGLEPRYLVYGGYHAGLLIGHQSVTRLARNQPGLAHLAKSPVWRWFAVAVTFNAVCFGFLIFSGRLG